jgi:hypothetical protein
MQGKIIEKAAGLIGALRLLPTRMPSTACSAKQPSGRTETGKRRYRKWVIVGFGVTSGRVA